MKDIKELIQSYQEFMELLGEKIELQCYANGNCRYNAFADKYNLRSIRFIENRISVEVMDGEDTFEYEVFISEFSDKQEDKELEELYRQLTDAESKARKAQTELNIYIHEKVAFDKLNAIYGVPGSMYDIVAYESGVNSLGRTIKHYKATADEIQAKISERTAK